MRRENGKNDEGVILVRETSRGTLDRLDIDGKIIQVCFDW
jgi:hypothetical protein